jgi:ATP-dependent protease HslVU (ClpYQ) peptidase subunit
MFLGDDVVYGVSEQGRRLWNKAILAALAGSSADQAS